MIDKSKKTICEDFFKSSAQLKSKNISVMLFDEIDSTNSEARRYAFAHEPDADRTCVFVARSQSAGRGRMGRSFFSPAGSGLYFTVLFNVSGLSCEQMLCLTPAAAVAVVRVAGLIGVKNAKIKWVNDILVNGKKACGILAESFNVGDKRYAAVGIGINLYTEAFPEELKPIATSFFGNFAQSDADERQTVLTKTAELLAIQMYDLEKMIESGDLSYMDEYRLASAVMGRRVSYVKEGEESLGTAVSIDDLGRLSVKDDSGDISLLSGGEISLFLK